MIDHTLAGLSGIPEVIKANAVAGDADLLCRVVAKDNAGLEEALQRIAVDAVQRTSTKVVLSR
ncbi:Lrp/AsnC ligand binding domain-containing protein [Streptomyces sp. SDT5-1]|uniref:Lrp/AsnC ligand binding domain-containing protein n=1 Tax=Streptomyces sp. SDT5-1 TaxID=3406418 RepID=UPI003FD20BDD